jgi:hypothetical protein
MEEILQDLKEFPLGVFISPLIIGLVSFFVAYLFYKKIPREKWSRNWKKIAVLFIIFWLLFSNYFMGRPFVRQENFESLTKVEGVLQKNDDEGFYLITKITPSPFALGIDHEEHFSKIQVFLLDNFGNVLKYKNQNVTVWQKNHVAYQLECDGKIIYTLERSNSKVWLGVIYDLIKFYLYTFCGILFLYIATLRTIEEN